MGVYKQDPHWLPEGIEQTLTVIDDGDAITFVGKVRSTNITKGGTFVETNISVGGRDVRRLIAELTDIADQRGL